MKTQLYKRPLRPLIRAVCAAAVIVLTVGGAALLSGCYVLKQGLRLVSNANAARPIDDLLEDPNLDPELRRMFVLSRAVKVFSEERLGLASDVNYTYYLDLGRDYVADVVSACRDLSFDPYFWKYPIFGAMPYRGYYYPEDARREAARLKNLNYDIIVRQVEAFSTLGYFKDPLYNFMTRYSPYALANLIIHEQTHATIFARSDPQFNEELATFVGNEGALMFLREVLEDGDYYLREAAPYNRDFDTFLKLLKELHDELAVIYDSGAAREEKLKRKRETQLAFRTRVGKNYGSYFETDAYLFLATDILNNAYITMWMQYTEDLSLYYTLYETLGKDLPAVIEALKPLHKSKGDVKGYVRTLAGAK